MDEQTTAVAVESSPAAPAAPATIEIPRSGTPEYAKWRMDGTIADKPKTEPAASSTADPDKAPMADANAPPAKKQESTEYKPKTEKRFQDLLSERDRLKAENEALKAPKPAPEPAKPAPQPQSAEREPTVEDKNPDGTFKYKTYEEFVKAQARWEVRQELAEQRNRETEQTRTQELLVKVNDARTRYGKEKVDEIIFPTSNAIRDDAAIPLAVKAMIGDSEVFPDLIFTLGSNKAEFASFLQLAKTEPGKALRRIRDMEKLIDEELSKGTTTATGRDASGKFTKPESTTPAKRGPESAPDPPLEIGHRGTGPMDESERALSDAQKGDRSAFRRWKDAEDRKELAHRRGA
jgi:hypothetical protein